MIEETGKWTLIMSDEPQLGKVRTVTHTYDRDDIIEAIIEEFEEGPIEDSTHQIYLGVDQESMSEYLSNENIEEISRQLATLPDDEWGSTKFFTLLGSAINGFVANDAEVEYEGEEYGD